MREIFNCSTGEFVRNQTEQEEQVYSALKKWCERLNKWEYKKQVERNKGRKLKTFIPNYISLQFIENMNNMTNGRITPEEVMSILHIIEVKTQLNLCMDAGF